MKVGIPKEIKNNEYRVGMIPASVAELILNGHEVFVETGAGLGVGFFDADYKASGAKILSSAEEIYKQSDMIVKVKEPQPVECKMLKPGQVLFTYLHLAPDPTQTKLLVESGVTAIAYETVTDSSGGLPLLAPMSEVAGRLSIQAGAHCLEKAAGGSGVLLSGVPGVKPGKVVVIGGGVVGLNALTIAVGMGANVTVLDKSLPKLRHLEGIFGSRLKTIFATDASLYENVVDADLVVGAVLIPGAAAPKIINDDMLKAMRPGSVLVDVSIDQGGLATTSRPTTYANPTYIEHDVVHYCVANMPGGVARTATFALNNVTLPFVLELANKGAKQAMLDDAHLLNGLNVHAGRITYRAVADALGYDFVAPGELLHS